MFTNHRQNDPFSVFIVDNNDTRPAQLKKYCPHVMWAKDPPVIVSLIQAVAFKIILLELTLNTFKLIPLIKGADCINQQTPIIGLIDPAEDFTEESILAAGFDDYLITPLHEDSIKALFDLWQINGHSTEPLAYSELILERTHNSRPLALTILLKLFDELPQQLIAIKTALTSNEYAHAEVITHKLHGSVSLCGFTNMEKSANALESSLIKRNYQAINPHFQLLQQNIIDFISKQDAILKHFKNP